MAFCSSCGAHLEDNEKFCHACGTPVASGSQAPVQEPADVPPTVPEEPVPVKKRGKGMRIAIAAVAAVAVLAVVVTLVSALFSGGPVETVFKAVAKTVEVTAEEGLPGLMSNVLEGGSVEITSDLSKWENMDDMQMQIGAKLYSNLPKQMAAATVNLEYEGAAIDAGLYAGKNSIALECDALFGEENVYGIDLSELEKNLPKSVLSPDADTEFSLDEYTYEEILTTLSGGDMEKLEELKKETVSFLKEYAEDIIKTLDKNAEIEQTSNTVSVGSSDIKTNQITITLDSKALAELVKVVGEKAQKDTELQQLVAEWLVAAKMDYMDMTSEEYVEEIQEAFEDLDDAVEMIADSNVKITAAFDIGKSSKTLVACSIKVKSDDETVSVKLTLGENPSTSEEVKLVLDNGRHTVVLEYEVKEDTNKSYSSKLTASEDGYEELSASFNWDKSENTYRLTVSIPYTEEITLKGTLNQKGSTTTLTLDHLNADGESMDINATLVLNEKDSITMPGYTDVLTLKESDFERIEETVMDNATDLMYDFGGLLNSLIYLR